MTMTLDSIESPALSGVAWDMIAVTPSDTQDISDGATDVSNRVAALRVGGAGNLSVVTRAGHTRTIPVAAGELLPLAVTRVNATNTTATTIWAFLV